MRTQGMRWDSLTGMKNPAIPYVTRLFTVGRMEDIFGEMEERQGYAASHRQVNVAYLIFKTNV